jgi:hypothetical protein
MNVHISLDYVLWMLDNPEKLNETEKLWVEEFKQLFQKKIDNEHNQPPLPEDNS